MQHAHELNSIFSEWCATHVLEEVLRAFQQAEGTLAPIYSIDQVMADPQMQARQAVTHVADPDFGSVAMPNVVPRFSHSPSELRNVGGEIGQDNTEIYEEWLGLSASEVEALYAKAVI